MNVPKIAAIVKMIGMAFLSCAGNKTTTGKANATEIKPPCNHHTMCGKSIFTIMIDGCEKVLQKSGNGGSLVQFLNDHGNNINRSCHDPNHRG